ncbi:hypothetical protein PHYC_02989 [Phycisphaerales bacterium]|nr:hypothetical protein PHYC_02989 [Phycisphaerales bacterium]
MRNVFVACVCALAGAASADVFSNGPFLTGTGNGAGGANTSAIEQPAYNNFGYNTLTGTFAVADDFTVSGGNWSLNTFKVYAYQTITAAPPAGSTITTMQVAVFTTNPIGTQNAPDHGNLVTPRTILTNVYTGTYRVTATTLTNDDRAIMAVTADVSDIPDLAPGTYYIAWSLTGSVASGPWTVPVTPARATDNAIQRNVGLAAPTNWALVDGNGTAAGVPQQDMAFEIAYDLIPSCDPDVNCDGAVNGFDVEATEQAVNGDFSNFCQATADLNGDGAENGFDIETEEQRVNGAPC